MKKIITLFALAVSMTAFAQKNKVSPKAEVTISPTSKGITLSGTGSFVEYRAGMVTAHIEVSGLTPLSQHAIHIHEYGNCDSSGKAAGGHWNPLMDLHGHLQMKHNDKSNHAHSGDIGNLVADEKGNATLYMFSDQWCVDCDDANKNILGKSIIVHEGQDDFMTQPTGGAGGRIGCGVIQRARIVGEQE